MIQTIEVEIDTNGKIEPLKKGQILPAGRAVLMISTAAFEASELNTEAPGIETLFGILKAERGATRAQMKAAVRNRAKACFESRD